MGTTTLDSFELLSGTNLASGMSLEQVQILSACGTTEEYQPGDALVNWDHAAFDLMVLVDGKCEIRTQMNDVLYQLGPNSLIGEISFIDRKPRSATCIAVTPCKAVRFPASLLEDLEGRRPDIAAKLLNNIGIVLCQKLRSTTRFAEASFV